MNVTEHLLCCLMEEALEVAKPCSKAMRFGPHDRNVLNPTGPTNIQRIVDELNDMEAVIIMLVKAGVIPPNWKSTDKVAAKIEKVTKFMKYAEKKGTLQ